MDLLSKTLVVAVVLVIIIAIAYFAFEKVFVPGPVTEQQAATIITQYLQSNNPNSQINITNESRSQYQGSWHVVVSVVTNTTTPCPTYIVYYFDYPKFSLVNNTNNVYTQGCRVIGYVKNQHYTVGSFPVAIVLTYNYTNNTAIHNFVNISGYKNVIVHASYYPNITVNGLNYTKVWIVNYSSTTNSKSVYAILSQVNGTFYSTYNASR